MSLPEPAALPPSQADLREYIQVLRVRKWTVVGVLALVVLGALAFSLTQTPLYLSEAKVQVRPITLSATDPSAVLNMETEKEIAAGANVAKLAAEELGSTNTSGLLENLSVEVEPDTEILVFSYTDPVPKRAREAAQAFADAYIADREDQAARDRSSIIQPIESRLNQLRTALAAREGELAAATDPETISDLETRRDGLIARIAILEEELAGVRTPGAVGQIIKPAETPSSPASPNHLVNLAVALVAGLALGVGMAFLRERLDDRIHGRQDLETHSRAPVLATVPTVRRWRRRDEPMMVVLTDPESPAAEAYRTLRTGVLFDAASQQSTKVILVTSAESTEGKTTTTANLGVSLAQAGKKVILVSADLRRPRLQAFFGRDRLRGLTNVLAGEAKLEEVLSRPPGMQNLSLLSSGPVPGNPAELLSSAAMRTLMAELRLDTDFVLMDGAPLLAVADSLALAQLADCVLLVADAQATHRSAVQHATELLIRVNARLLGAVLNNFDPTKSRGYQSYTAYRGYSGNGNPSGPPSRRILRRR